MLDAPLIFRASSLADIMTEPKKKGEVLSVGAKTAIKKLAKQAVYGYREEITSKYTDKGLRCEDDSIDLLNSVYFTNYVKNTERKTNEWVTGECDIFTGDSIIDIKTSWSLATFPVTEADCQDTTYEWQMRAYMWLWDCDRATVAYCMVDTPEDLIRYEQLELHRVTHIDQPMRVTQITYERDPAKEALIIEKVEAARVYYRDVLSQINAAHKY